MKLPKFSLSFSLLLILFLFRCLSLLLLLLFYATRLLLLFAPLISTGIHFLIFPVVFFVFIFLFLTQLFDNITRFLICHLLVVLFFLQQGTIKSPQIVLNLFYMPYSWLHMQKVEQSSITLGETHWLRPPILARLDSNHLHELFYDRRSW